MVKVTILNETGHTELVLSGEEALEQILDHPTHWAYIDGALVSRNAINSLDFGQVEEVVLTHAIVGGSPDLDDDDEES
jgi:hypothetical protein